MLTWSKRRNINSVFLLTIFLSIFLVACGGQGESSYVKCSQNLNQDIQQIIDEGRTKYGIPGLQVSIGCPGEKQPRNFVSGTTTIDGTALIKPTTLFQIGSVTKSFTAAILLRIEADGRVSIDDPIGKWLPHQVPPDWKKITIKQLLNHTSGIANYTETDEFNRIEQDSQFKKQWTPEELISLVVNKPPYFQPGKGYHYSNTDYVLAGMIISAVPGKSIEEEMKTLLTKTLPLPNTYYLPHPYSKEITERMAHGYYPSEENGSLIDATDYNMSMAGAAGAMVSNSQDIAIWIRKLLTTAAVLPEKQRKKMMSLVDIENGQPIPITSEKTGSGLGIHPGIIFGSKAWLRGGATNGYLTQAIWLTCQDVVITTIMNINSEGGAIGSLIADLIAYIQKSDTLGQCQTS